MKKCIRFSGLIFVIFFFISTTIVFSQKKDAAFHYTISIPDPTSHTYNVQLNCSNWSQDSIRLKMPRWMPGYYQIMDYPKSVENLMVKDYKGNNIPVNNTNENTWFINGIKNKAFTVNYTIRTKRQFVANSYVDSAHAYIIPANTFLYADGYLDMPVSVSLSFDKAWTKVATGLDVVPGKTNEFTATDFDILYDCPILIGNLEELPSFKVKGVEHRFIGYNMGSFDKALFMNNLKRTVAAAVEIIGDIPFKQYTFIGIGPGRGGIEHLNNTTVSFDGNGLDKPGTMNRIMNFLAHEYFHHYNVKRIRPFELGPFDYDKGSRTNLLWVSEGLSVYYEYLAVKRAGLVADTILFANFNNNLNAIENNPGRLYQSLQQASYRTWNDGPFGTGGNEKGKTISYYEKGPLVGMLLDFEIRNATENKRSLDDVMRLLYWKYYKEKNRGFTEAEFQAACEEAAGIPLNAIFEYVYSTKELDYEKYLAYAGLKLDKHVIESKDKGMQKKWKITKSDSPTPLQAAILRSWLGE